MTKAPFRNRFKSVLYLVDILFLFNKILRHLLQLYTRKVQQHKMYSDSSVCIPVMPCCIANCNFIPFLSGFTFSIHFSVCFAVDTQSCICLKCILLPIISALLGIFMLLFWSSTTYSFAASHCSVSCGNMINIPFSLSLTPISSSLAEILRVKDAHVVKHL